MTKNKLDSIGKDTILHADKKNYICLLKSYGRKKISTEGFIRSFFRIYHEAYKKWMQIESSEELIFLNVKALGFDSEVLVYFEDKCYEVADNLTYGTLSKECELEFRYWTEDMLFELQNYW